MEPMTPYAVLLVKPSDSDEVIRKAYHKLAEKQHPDKTGGAPGEHWYLITKAYNAVKTEELRCSWAATQYLLSGWCATCNGSGVVGTRMFKGRIRLCSECEGKGRTL